MKIKSIKKVHLETPKQYYDVINAYPYNNFLIKTNSSNIISHNCNFTDEVNFGLTSNVEKLKKKQKRIISQVDARMKSRYMREKNGKTYLPTLNIIASSKNSEQAFLEDYIETKRKNESKTTLIVDEPQWVVDSRKDSPEKFYVAIGNKFLANELLPRTATEETLSQYRAKGYSILAVPKGYWEDFNDNIDNALMDIAGIASASSLKYISGVRWNEIKNKDYENPFTKEIISVGNGKDDNTQYFDYFDLNKIDSRIKSKPLFIHLDMSVSGDKTGLAGVWIVGKRPKVEGENDSKELFFRVAFSVSIEAPKGYQISFDKHIRFIKWLKEHGFSIKGISSDSYSAVPVHQALKSEGFDVSTISVDRLDPTSKQCLPYVYFKSTLYERRLEIYDKCDFLTEEVLGLEREADGHINHSENGTQGSKDQIDSIVGALYNASQNAEQFAFDFGEDINTTIDVSKSISSSDAQKRQINIQFEEQLKDLLDPIKKSSVPKNEPNDINQSQVVENNSNNTNNNVYKPIDFGFGSAKPWKPSSVRDGIIYWG